MVEVKFNLGKREGVFLVIAALFFSLGLVVAYNPLGIGGDPSIMGHSPDEIEVNTSQLNFQDVMVNVNQLCMNGSCISDFQQIMVRTHLVAGPEGSYASCPVGETAVGYVTTVRHCFSTDDSCTTGNHAESLAGNETNPETCAYDYNWRSRNSRTCTARSFTRCQY